VVLEFLTDRMERPHNRTLENARQEELARLQNSTALAQAETARVLAAIADRELTIEQQASIRDAMQPFAGQTVILRSYPSEPESARLILQLKAAFSPPLEVIDETGQLEGTWAKFRHAVWNPCYTRRSRSTIRRKARSNIARYRQAIY
jgi:hypothetical protein